MHFIRRLSRSGTEQTYVASELFIERSYATVLGALGMLVLLIAWRFRNAKLEKVVPLAWLFTGFYFFNETPFYLDKADWVLTIMSSGALPGALAIAYWERSVKDERDSKALHWFRGAIAAAGLPYLMIAYIPWLNVLAIWFVAWQSAALLKFAGGQDVTLGETVVKTSDGTEIPWESWEGNRWFLTEEMSEYGFYTELMVNGEYIHINFVLACTAIQSMIIFVGAISVLDIGWKSRVRALFISLSLIHILNLFRNAGLIWLQLGYQDWRWMGFSIFEFGHSYASRVVSLGAMFLLALVLFEMLPQMHRNVLRLMRPMGLAPGKRSKSVK